MAGLRGCGCELLACGLHIVSWFIQNLLPAEPAELWIWRSSQRPQFDHGWARKNIWHSADAFRKLPLIGLANKLVGTDQLDPRLRRNLFEDLRKRPLVAVASAEGATNKLGRK